LIGSTGHKKNGVPYPVELAERNARAAVQRSEAAERQASVLAPKVAMLERQIALLSEEVRQLRMEVVGFRGSGATEG